MKQKIFIICCIILAGCRSPDKKKLILVQKTLKRIDTNITTQETIESVAEDPYDSIRKAKIDTTTLKGKRKYLVNQFLLEQSPMSPEYDTLRDLNFDGYKDYIIGYYAAAGTGIKHKVKVYFYNSKKKCYMLNELLSDLPNPTFYIDKKKITGFYIGMGGGGGGRLEWIHGKWITTKEFDVHNEDNKTIWNISYPLSKRKVKLKRSFQMIPPDDILETEVKD